MSEHSTSTSVPAEGDWEVEPRRWYTLAQAARVWGVDKKTARARIETAAWPLRKTGNRFEFQPPEDVAAGLADAVGEPVAERPVTEYTKLSGHPKTRERILRKQDACEFVNEQLADGTSFAEALTATCIHFRQVKPPFSFSESSLRKWHKAYSQRGINGLVENRVGRCGRKRAADSLPPDMITLGKALTAEYKSRAKASRVLASHPDLPAGAREFLHGAHASKSYVTPSIKEALRVDPQTESLLQGPRRARLDGRWTPGDYSNVKAGDVFTSDDMTSNVFVWLEWPCAEGWRIVQPQILPVLDVGSLRWLNVRVIARHGGQYNSDDIWGLFGDVFDSFGLPRRGFLLEGGHWQSQKVRGYKTGIDDDDRIGGLEGLGLEVKRSYDPRSKHIEGMFHHFQTECDRICGYAGRDQRKQLPEAVKKQLALCKGGHAHPRQFFLHIRDFSNHVHQVMENMNHEQREGAILGQTGEALSALEKWALDNPRLNAIPDEARWMYRSARAKVKVTRNGIRITHGSGAKQLVYYYDNPEILTARTGQTVHVFWNDQNPDADAIVLDHNRRFLCTAGRVNPIDRFGGTDEELATERQRKQASMHYSRTEMRTMQPHLARRAAPVPYDGDADQLGREIRKSTERAEEKERTRQQTKRRVSKARFDAEDLEAMTEYDRHTPDELSHDEIAELLRTDAVDEPAEHFEPEF